MSRARELIEAELQSSRSDAPLSEDAKRVQAAFDFVFDRVYSLVGDYNKKFGGLGPDGRRLGLFLDFNDRNVSRGEASVTINIKEV